jgi:hypothetical protein
MEIGELGLGASAIWKRLIRDAYRYKWGRQPQAFIQSWNMVARTVKARAPDTCTYATDETRFMFLISFTLAFSQTCCGVPIRSWGTSTG